MYGYAGRILRVDLSNRTWRVEEPAPEVLRKFIGGRGLIAYYVWKEQRGVKPLTEEHNFYIFRGPLSGTPTPGSGKLDMGHKSPETGGYGDSNVGGNFSHGMLMAGWDGFILEGVSSEPVVLVINDEGVTFRPANDLWGRGAIETEAVLKRELGEDWQILSIGPAGENLVKFACVNHDLGREAGRTGVGATLGYKKVKAVAVKGTGTTVKYADPEGLNNLQRESMKYLLAQPSYKEWVEYGTSSVVGFANKNGVFPYKNFWGSYMEGHETIDGPVMVANHRLRNKGCYACPTPCGKVSKFDWNGKEYVVEGAEYETLALVGGNIAFRDIKAVLYINYLMDELGVDTISGGNVIAWAIEAYEKGLIKPSDVDGRQLKWGDVATVEYLLDKIVKREGIGAILAEGVRHAANVFGGKEFAMEVKGLEISGYESRWAPAMALSYGTADIGAHHNRAWAVTYDIMVGHKITDGTAAKVVELQHIRPLFDQLCTCRLQWVEVNYPLDYYPKFMQAVTGWDWTWDEMIESSERVWNLTRMFWFSEVPGFGRDWDYLPHRWFHEPVPEGPAKGAYIDRAEYDKLLDQYYELRGWDKNGKPRAETIKRLGLDDLVE
ncbi:aldehyde ferredoxin oxidoreductase family protein [Coprothermobacteraceae bacterium]|nr:aldehyde ferredoxin oxidoreductase family protein [Coprothermobacteraceae bacterium]